MSDISNLPNSKKIILKTRPNGDPKVSDFEMIEEVAKAPDDGEVLVEVQALGVGAWIRTTLNETAFHGSTPIGGTLPSMGIGKVLISKSDKLNEGDVISGPLMAQSYTTMSADFFTKVLE